MCGVFPVYAVVCPSSAAAYLVFRQSLYCDEFKPWVKVLAGILTVLICASTVLVKQHVVLDIIGGIVCAEIAMQWGMRSNVWKVFYKVNKKLMPKIWREVTEGK